MNPQDVHVHTILFERVRQLQKGNFAPAGCLWHGFRTNL